ncbi:hypothetical protein MRX96_055495 [Rhipicephalus microplus]
MAASVFLVRRSRCNTVPLHPIVVLAGDSIPRGGRGGWTRLIGRPPPSSGGAGELVQTTRNPGISSGCGESAECPSESRKSQKVLRSPVEAAGR